MSDGSEEVVLRDERKCVLDRDCSVCDRLHGYGSKDPSAFLVRPTMAETAGNR